VARVTRRGFLGWLAAVPLAVLRPWRALAAERTVEIICRGAWGARKPTGEFRRHRIHRLTVHHSATVLGDNREAPERFRDEQRNHQGRGWPDIAYHVLIDRHGNVYRGRPMWAEGDTATEYNPRGHLQLMCEGNFERQRPSDAQVQALVDVLAWAAARFNVGVRTVRGHRDYAATACPGDALYHRLSEVRRRVRERLDRGGVRLVELCGEAGKDRVEAIEAGLD
jgi:hypothetical protein